MTWKEYLMTARGRYAALFCVVILSMMFGLMPAYYRDIITPKPSILLDDPILNLFTPIDWSTPVFFILTVAILQTVAFYIRTPSVLFLGLTTYCAINVVRMITIYAITLEPPSDMILLVDPFSARFAYPDASFAKDLFFSGHVSTMMVMVLIERVWVLKVIKIIGTALMALFLAWQHVHYSVDLVVAPIATYCVFLLAKRFFDGLSPEFSKTQISKKMAF